MIKMILQNIPIVLLMNLIQLTRLLLLICLITLLFGCAVIPKNLDDQQSDIDGAFIRQAHNSNIYLSIFGEINSSNNFSLSNDILYQLSFSRGDVLKIRFHSMPDYNGLYKITANGKLELPFTDAIQAVPLTRSELIKQLQQQLAEQKWFLNSDVLIDISLVQTSSIDVSVFGAVFNQGRVNINAKPANKPQDNIQQQSGAYSTGRNLITAIVAAGGVRPDADLHKVFIKRNERVYHLDLFALIEGSDFVETPSLVNGDQIFIESNGVENTNLIRPSQITPPGMRVLMSNLTAPALSNSIAAVGADSTRLPYGASLLDAALSANCVGGTHQANASRTIILITRHHGASQQIVIKRTINSLLAASSDFSVNPFLMPNDGVACYDSKFTNIRDVARGVGELFGPILLGGLL